MSLINNLNDSYNLLNKLDDVIIKNPDNDSIKKQLLSFSENLARYKDIDQTNIKFDNDEIKLKLIDVLNKINEIETNVKNKLIITEKYNSHLNS